MNLKDTTYCNYQSPRYAEGVHTGDIYDHECDGPEDEKQDMWIHLIQENKLEPWSY